MNLPLGVMVATEAWPVASAGFLLGGQPLAAGARLMLD